MSYFNHAYKKTFLGKTWERSASQATSTLGAGELSVVDACTYQSIAQGGVAAAAGDIMIVQGNYNQTDTLGGNPLHGGYSESIKSKIIKPQYINKMWVSCCVDQCCPSITLTVPENCYDCDPLDNTSTGDQTGHPQIRLDIKGTEVLRALNRNAYFVADMTGCCPEGGYYTPADVVEAWKTAIERDASGMSDFVTVTTTSETITIELCPSETVFDCCSFDTRDAYSHETLDLGVSLITAEGAPCEGGCVTYQTTECPVGTADLPAGQAFTNGVPAWITRTPSETLGEEVLREIIMDGRYRQDGGWNQGNKDSSRFREIEGGSLLCAEFPVTTNEAGQGRRAPYKYFYIQHTVPRYNNPTGVFDNDQYVVAIAIPCGATALVTETLNVWIDIAALATNLTASDFEYGCDGSGIGSVSCSDQTAG